MRAILFFLACLLLTLSGAHAQFGFVGVQGLGTAPPPTYTGPCDIATFQGWYGLRACGSATATGTQKAIQVRVGGVGPTQDILILAGGGLDIATATSFCTSTCKLSLFYDQSGNGNDLNQQFNLELHLSGCTGGSVSYCLENGAMYRSGVTSATRAYTEVVGTQFGAFTTQEIWAGSPAGNSHIGNGPTLANTAYASTVIGTYLTATAANSTAHVIQAVFGTSGVISVDGTETTGSTGAVRSETDIQFGDSGVSAYLWEAGFSSTSPSSGSRTSVCHNARLYWGTAGSC